MLGGLDWIVIGGAASAGFKTSPKVYEEAVKKSRILLLKLQVLAAAGCGCPQQNFTLQPSVSELLRCPKKDVEKKMPNRYKIGRSKCKIG